MKDSVELKLTKKPDKPIIISGFPGFGMVGTIATEFLVEHLKTEQIGRILISSMPALIAIHEGKLVEPFGIYYNKEFNIVIIHSLSGTPGTEWKIAEGIMQLSEQLQATEIISLEGVGSNEETEHPATFFFSTDKDKAAEFKKLKIEKLEEGIIMGVTSALLLKMEKPTISCIFSETHTNLPDSKAAAKIIEALDGYLGLKIDTTPLLEMAEKFEEKLKGIMQQSKIAEDQRDKKTMSYVG